MKIFLKLFFLCSLLTGAAFPEEVPPPIEPDVRHIIQIPNGGLKRFLRWHSERIPLISHHRAGPAPGFPENAIETMDNALKYGPGLMEVDVAELADGTLVLMHDRTLDRTTTGSGKIIDKTWAEVEKLFLEDENSIATNFRIPRLEQVLRWAKGRAILTLDIKPATDFKKIVAAVKMTKAEDYVAVIAYSLDQALMFHAMAPDMPITVTMRNQKEFEAVLASGIPMSHIIAWTGTSALSPEFYNTLHGKGWRVIMGTLGGVNAIDKQIAANDNDERYLDFFQSGVDVIATDRFWAVQNQIRNPNQYFFVQRKQIPMRRGQP